MTAATLIDNGRGDLIELVRQAAATVDYLDALQCQLAETMPKGSPVLERMEEVERDLRAAHLDVQKEMGLLRDVAEPDGNEDEAEEEQETCPVCHGEGQVEDVTGLGAEKCGVCDGEGVRVVPQPDGGESADRVQLRSILHFFDEVLDPDDADGWCGSDIADAMEPRRAALAEHLGLIDPEPAD